MVPAGEEAELLVGLKNDGRLNLLSDYSCNESQILGYDFCLPYRIDANSNLGENAILLFCCYFIL